MNMKRILILGLVMLLGACSILQGKRCSQPVPRKPITDSYISKEGDICYLKEVDNRLGNYINDVDLWFAVCGYK